MTLYDDSVQRWREDLSEKQRAFVDEIYPCHCDDAWTDRGMHRNDCEYASAIDVLQAWNRENE